MPVGELLQQLLLLLLAEHVREGVAGTAATAAPDAIFLQHLAHRRVRCALGAERFLARFLRIVDDTVLVERSRPAERFRTYRTWVERGGKRVGWVGL